MNSYLFTAAANAGRHQEGKSMPKKPPHKPTGMKVGMLTDGGATVGILTFETSTGDVDVALNLEAVGVLSRAINTIELQLRREMPKRR